MNSTQQVLAGQVALITGGARGMGEAEARLFAQQGATVIIADVLDTEGAQLAHEIGDNASYMHLDVSDENNWAQVMGSIDEQYGGLDILVNNAGILRFATIEDMTLEQYMAIVNINQVGTFLGMRSAIPLLRKKSGKSIINISSFDAMTGSNGLIAYAASKWAIRGMTKVAARELGQEGIRVNSVHPGGISTAMTGDTSSWAHNVRKLVPLYRAGEPEEIAKTVLFLASNQSSYTTGSEFTVDGGLANCNLYETMPGAPVDQT